MLTNTILMKIKSHFKLRQIVGETIIVNQGTTEVDMTSIISLNTTAKFLYEQLQGKEFTLEDAAKVLETTYNIGYEQAIQDATTWVEALKDCKVIE